MTAPAPMRYDGNFWYCDAKGEAWDLELHSNTPCEESIRLHGDSPGEHARCGPCIIEVIETAAR